MRRRGMTASSVEVGGREWVKVRRSGGVVALDMWRAPARGTVEIPIAEILVALNLSDGAARRLLAEHTARNLDIAAEERARVTPAIRRHVARVAGYRCHWCRRYGTVRRCPDGAAWAVDHVMPIHLGGTSDLPNLVLSCPRCNREKGIQHPDDWRRLLATRTPVTV